MLVLRAIVILFTLASVHPASADEAADVRAAIEASNASFASAYSEKNAAAIAARYTNDGALLPPGDDMISGTEGIETFWKGLIDYGVANLSFSTIEVEAHGDLAYENGVVSYEVPVEGGGKAAAQAKYLVVWKKADGAWKMHRDMWNDPKK
jgi:uncharacterized protein (TIGR02246 family)